MQGDIRFGTPGLLWILQKVIFPGVPASDIYLHPVARAAWIGILATALNLLPIGQLDGGHILYSLVGDKHKLLSKIFIAALLPMGFWWWPWWLWAVALFFLARRHPVIVDPSEKLMNNPVGYTPDENQYNTWLQCGLDAFHKSN